MPNNTLPKKIVIAHICLLGATLIWGAAGPIIKMTLGYIPPAIFLSLRFLIVAIVLLPYTVYELTKTKVHPKDYVNLFILGLLSQSAILLIFIAYKYTTVLDATIIGVAGAILSVYMGHYFYKDELDRRLTVGLILASMGTLVVVLEPLLSNGAHIDISGKKVLGNLLVILYNLSWITFLLFSKMSMGENSRELKRELRFLRIKPMKQVYSPTLIVSLSFYVGFITTIPFAMTEYIKTGMIFNLNTIEPAGIFGLFYMAIMSSIVAYMLYGYGLEFARISDTALYGYLQPLLTLPFAYYLIGEVPNLYMLVGGTVIAIGVIIAEARKY